MMSKPFKRASPNGPNHRKGRRRAITSRNESFTFP